MDNLWFWLGPSLSLLPSERTGSFSPRCCCCCCSELRSIYFVHVAVICSVFFLMNRLTSKEKMGKGWQMCSSIVLSNATPSGFDFSRLWKESVSSRCSTLTSLSRNCSFSSSAINNRLGRRREKRERASERASESIYFLIEVSRRAGLCEELETLTTRFNAHMSIIEE